MHGEGHERISNVEYMRIVLPIKKYFTTKCGNSNNVHNNAYVFGRFIFADSLGTTQNKRKYVHTVCSRRKVYIYRHTEQSLHV